MTAARAMCLQSRLPDVKRPRLAEEEQAGRRSIKEASPIQMARSRSARRLERERGKEASNWRNSRRKKAKRWQSRLRSSTLETPEISKRT